jgi:hypothetical protein
LVGLGVGGAAALLVILGREKRPEPTGSITITFPNP